MNKDQILMYKAPDGKASVEVKLAHEMIWLSQDQMAELFDKAKSTINEHIKNIYKENELSEEGTKRKFGNSEFLTSRPIFTTWMSLFQSVIE